MTGQEFIIQIAPSFAELMNAIAWPIAVLILGYIFRERISRLVNRFRKGKGFGVEVEAQDERYYGDETPAFDSTIPKEDQLIIENLRNLTVSALRLLSIVVSIGIEQKLNLSHYPGVNYERGKQQLLDYKLVRMDEEWYRPTLNGAKALEKHVQNVREALEK